MHDKFTTRNDLCSEGRANIVLRITNDITCKIIKQILLDSYSNKSRLSTETAHRGTPLIAAANNGLENSKESKNVD